VVRRSRQDGAALSLPFAFNRAPLALLPVLSLALACTRINPDYCDQQIQCGAGRSCDRKTSTCRSADAAADSDAPDGGLDARAADAPNSCATDDDCQSSALGPTCVHGQCKKCQGANECKTSLVCAIDTGRCVQCTDSEGCLDTPASPICLQSQCVPCTRRPDGCAGKYPDLPFCDPSGACVECSGDKDCQSPTRPICDSGTKKCVACVSDLQCANKGGNAGVCMFHQDGRCASTDEVIHVQNGPGCSMNPGVGGTLGAPFCFSQHGLDAVTATKRVVVLHGPDALTNWTAAPIGAPVTVVGQGNATIAPGAFVGIRLGGGEVYLRGLTISGGTQTGVVVENGAVLRMDRCTLTGNRGGLLVLNAGFDIANSVIAANKGAVVPNSATSYGGVYLRTAPGKPAIFRNDTIVDNEVIGLVCAEGYAVKNLLVAGNAVEQVLGCTPATSSVGVPPRFDPQRPYHLTAASPCVNMGDPSDFPGDDLDGDPRPLGGASDCGADELEP
jgi:hypothetical protein